MSSVTKTLASFFLLAILAGPVLGQGMYVDRGYGAEGRYLLADGEYTFDFSVGYVPTKWFDAGMFLERYHRDDKTLAHIGIGPRASFYPVKQSDSFPATIYAQGWIAKHFLSGRDIDLIEDMGGESSQYSWTAGVSVQTRFNAWGDSMLQPRIGFYTTQTTWEITGIPAATKQTNSSNWVEIRLEMVVGEDGMRMFHIGPTVRASKDVTTVGLTVGFGVE